MARSNAKVNMVDNLPTFSPWIVPERSMSWDCQLLDGADGWWLVRGLGDPKRIEPSSFVLVRLSFTIRTPAGI